MINREGLMPKRPRMLKRISQQDIAREANVSRVTVSLVLAGKDQTSKETRKRVLEVANRLKYRPNLLVQGMQSGRTGTIGMIMPPSMHFHTEIARGINQIVLPGVVIRGMKYALRIQCGVERPAKFQCRTDAFAQAGK